MLSDHLFSQFDGISKKEWIEKIEKDLKGKPYQNLKKNNSANIGIEPIYNSEDVQLKDEAPGGNSYRRGSKTQNNEWVIDELFELTENPKADNSKILELLNTGLTGITFNGDISGEVLNDILPQYVTLGFNGYSNLRETIEVLISKFGTNPNTYSIHLNYDPIGEGAITGNFSPKFINEGIDAIKQLTPYKLARVFTVNGNSYHNAGGNAVSEITFALAHAHEYLVAMLKAGLTIDEASAQIKFDLASGSDYFLELAKFRAFRMLWAQVIDAYKPEHNCSKTAYIHAQSSQFLSTVFDPYVNMLRGTTQSMSAALGGCDALRVLPFNTAWSKGNDFGKRIARNTQLLIKEESYFDKVIDPAGGSYYIESLTDSLVEKAWTKFRKIEKKGGFLGLMTSGNLARELGEDADEQILRLNDGETKVLGVTLYPNNDEKMLSEIEETDSIMENNEPNFAPIKLLRLVGKKEEERLNLELTEADK
ncbi:MAG: methylmalonyl-CoA mutase subunit beta [Salibacteraceae bacterium]